MSVTAEVPGYSQGDTQDEPKGLSPQDCSKYTMGIAKKLVQEEDMIGS